MTFFHRLDPLHWQAYGESDSALRQAYEYFRIS